MPRTQKIITPKGSRYPGSGTKKGYVRPVSVEARQLVTEMVSDAQYQQRLRRDFALRKLHPTIESLVWAYALGKPRQDIQLSGNVEVNGRLEEERRVFLQLDIADLEQLAMESQALVDRATALAEARSGGVKALTTGENGDLLKVSPDSLGKTLGSDNGGYDNHSQIVDSEPIKPTDTEG